MSTLCPKMSVVTSRSTSILIWSARPTSCALFEGSAATDDAPVAIARRELVADLCEINLTVEERTGGQYGSDDISFSDKGHSDHRSLHGGKRAEARTPRRACSAVRQVALTIPATTGPVIRLRTSIVRFWSRTPARLCARSMPWRILTEFEERGDAGSFLPRLFRPCRATIKVRGERQSG